MTAAGPGIGSLEKRFWFSLFNSYMYWLSSCEQLAGGGDLAGWLDKGLTTSNAPSIIVLSHVTWDLALGHIIWSHLSRGMCMCDM